MTLSFVEPGVRTTSLRRCGSSLSPTTRMTIRFVSAGMTRPSVSGQVIAITALPPAAAELSAARRALPQPRIAPNRQRVARARAPRQENGLF